MVTVKKMFWAGVLVLVIPSMGPAQEVFKEIASPRLEDILKSMDIQFSKGDNSKGVIWYDYKTKNATLRLTNFSGKDLMIDAFLAKVDWEVINKWNSQSKFSRAHLEKNDKGEATVIVANLGLAGGVTEETVKHFILDFDQELARWANKPVVASGGPVGGSGEEETYNNVTADRLEKILSSLNIQFKKQLNKGNPTAYYDFERNNKWIRLTNFGGADLMIDCEFQPAPLAKINNWNQNRNYIRAVLYERGGKTVSALECNLDCVAGTSDSIIRNFIEAFDEEVKAFDEHLKK